MHALPGTLLSLSGPSSMLRHELCQSKYMSAGGAAYIPQGIHVMGKWSPGFLPCCGPPRPRRRVAASGEPSEARVKTIVWVPWANQVKQVEMMLQGDTERDAEKNVEKYVGKR